MHSLRKHTARLRPVRLCMWDERNGFDMTILVIDGQGGKLGKRLVESIKKSFPQVEVMGEISPSMANAVAASAAYRVLIPMNLCDTYVAGVSQKSSAIMDDAMEHIRQLLTEMGDTACL